MKPKRLLIAVVLLAALAGATWWSNKKNPTGQPASASAPKIMFIPDDQFQQIRIQKTGAEPLVLKRDKDNTWRIDGPKPLLANQGDVGSMVTTLGTLSADKEVEDKAADLSPYGLNHPLLDVQVTKKDGKTQELLMGDETPTGAGSYVKLASDGHVYTVESYVKPSIDKSVNDLRDKHLMTFDTDKLTRVDLNVKGQDIEFGKNGNNEWQILKPRPLRADNSSVESAVSKLKESSMNLLEDGADMKKSADGFASGTKVFTGAMTDAASTQTLEVRKDKNGNYYAKSSVLDAPYKTYPDLADSLNKSLEDFRNKKLFDFGFSEPSQVVIKNGAAAPVTYTKSSDSKNGDKWMSGSKQMDGTTMQGLLDALRDLAATKFPEKGGGESVFEATATSNDGKRVEHVVITKLGNQYFATRENEPSVYELDSKSVEDLQKDAGAIKEAAPPAKQAQKK